MVEYLIRYLHRVEMSQKQGDAAQLEKDGEKKKDKSTITWHKIECDSSVKKNDSKVPPVYNQSRLRRSERTCYFCPQPKAGALGTVKDNPIDLCDEEDG